MAVTATRVSKRKMMANCSRRVSVLLIARMSGLAEESFADSRLSIGDWSENKSITIASAYHQSPPTFSFIESYMDAMSGISNKSSADDRESELAFSSASLDSEKLTLARYALYNAHDSAIHRRSQQQR